MQFQTTLWTRIEEAAEQSPDAARELVQRYQQPIVRYLRGRGASADDADDLAQEVFVRLFAKDLLARADRHRGRFRSYLLAITCHVLLDHREREGALKRGGGRARVPLDAIGEPGVLDPDPEFDACWASGIIDAALMTLKQEHALQYRVLQVSMKGEKTHQEIGDAVGRTAAEVKSDLHRARQRLKRLIKQEIARYCSSPEELADELKAFRGVL